jgi:hypothetical protein
MTTMSRTSKSIGFVAGLLTVFAILTGGCPNDLLASLTEERSGEVSIIIINNTPYRASFTLGGYDALVRNPPSEPELEQRRVEAMTSTAPISMECVRSIAIGTRGLVERVLETDGNLAADFDNDAFSEFVNFSSAPIDDEAAALPTEGRAEGREVRLGWHYGCGDQLIFIFEEDATTTGEFRFRIEYTLLQTSEDE